MVGLFLQSMNNPFARVEAGQDHVDYTQFDGARAFDTMGFADSAGAANGRAGTQEVDGNKLEEKELLREKREKRDKTNELIELGVQLRQSRSESVTVGGISLSIGEWKDIRDTLDDPGKLALLKEQMRAQGKTEAEIDESIDIAKMASNIAVKKYQGKPLTSEEQAFADNLEDDPAAQQQFKNVAENVAAKSASRLESDRSVSENTNALAASIDDEAQFRVSANEKFSPIEVERAEFVRSGISTSDNPFANVSNVSSDFNSSASGVEMAAAVPSTTKELGVSPVVLTNG
ncbi:hypothetical protein ACR9YC_12730 [Parasphingorhabdus sp. DH2-15]|uniref:hypothetical protein n=1 Tax=Parasphingorhabdus sp. DH2-15 TaxID=3444112 RepID=UPI003F6849F6